MGWAERQPAASALQRCDDLPLLGIGQVTEPEGHGRKLVEFRVSSRVLRGDGLSVRGCARGSKPAVDERPGARGGALSFGARLLGAGLLRQALSRCRRYGIDPLQLLRLVLVDLFLGRREAVSYDKRN